MMEKANKKFKTVSKSRITGTKGVNRCKECSIIEQYRSIKISIDIILKDTYNPTNNPVYIFRKGKKNLPQGPLNIYTLLLVA